MLCFTCYHNLSYIAFQEKFHMEIIIWKRKKKIHDEMWEREKGKICWRAGWWYRRRKFLNYHDLLFMAKSNIFAFWTHSLHNMLPYPLNEIFIKNAKNFRDMRTHKISHDHIEFSPWGLERNRQPDGWGWREKVKLKITCWRS